MEAAVAAEVQTGSGLTPPVLGLFYFVSVNTGGGGPAREKAIGSRRRPPPQAPT